MLSGEFGLKGTGNFFDRSGKLLARSGNLSNRSGIRPLWPTRMRLLAGTGILSSIMLWWVLLPVALYLAIQ
jgi:hypothetical protein